MIVFFRVLVRVRSPGGSQPFFSHGPLFNNYQAYGPSRFYAQPSTNMVWFILFQDHENKS